MWHGVAGECGKCGARARLAGIDGEAEDVK